MIKLLCALFILPLLTVVMSDEKEDSEELALWQCGRRVSNGTTPERELYSGTRNYPWIVKLALPVESNFRYSFRCIALILSRRLLLTTARCAQEPNLTVYAGNYRLNTFRYSEQVTLTNPPIIHPKFDPKSTVQDYNIAIFPLKRPLNFEARYIVPICIPPNDFVAGPRTRDGNLRNIIEVAGWGARAKGGNRHDFLQHVMLPMLSNELCKLDVTLGRATPYAQNREFCTTYSASPRECVLDEGSPATVEVDGISYLIGLATSRDPSKFCKHVLEAERFVRVSRYNNWLVEAVANQSALDKSIVTQKFGNFTGEILATRRSEKLQHGYLLHYFLSVQVENLKRDTFTKDYMKKLDIHEEAIAPSKSWFG